MEETLGGEDSVSGDLCGEWLKNKIGHVDELKYSPILLVEVFPFIFSHDVQIN